MSDDGLCDLPATVQTAMIRSKEVSARELLAAHLERIEAVNPKVNAIVALDPSVGERRAVAIDEATASGRADELGPLAGLVTAHKDLAATVDFPTSEGSLASAGNRPSADAMFVARMKEAGAVAIGKTNVPEFGAGSHTFNEVYGTTLNPYDLSRTAGGSSGGAGVGLACRMLSVADGSDFGGSLRNPAGWNNVVGFRNTAGAIPHPSPGNSWQPMPVMGAMARSVDDVALLLGVMAQPSIACPLGRGLAVPDEILAPDRPLRVAYSPTLGGLPVEADVAAAVADMARSASDLGWEVEEAEPDFTGADECFITLRAFSFASKAEALAPFRDQIKATVVDEMDRGLALSGPDVMSAYTHLKVLWDRSNAFFADYDLLLAPVSQVSPFPIETEYPMEVAGQKMEHYIEWMLSCCRITALGVPALSLPAGFTPAGLPVGVQVIGGPWCDIDVLRAAKALEAVTGYASRRPSIL